MMQVLPKWKVTVTFATGREAVVWIHDNFMANVLRSVATLEFSDNGLEQPTYIGISRVTGAPPNVTVGQG